MRSVPEAALPHYSVSKRKQEWRGEVNEIHEWTCPATPVPNNIIHIRCIVRVCYIDKHGVTTVGIRKKKPAVLQFTAQNQRGRNQLHTHTYIRIKCGATDEYSIIIHANYSAKSRGERKTDWPLDLRNRCWLLFYTECACIAYVYIELGYWCVYVAAHQPRSLQVSGERNAWQRRKERKRWRVTQLVHCCCVCCKSWYKSVFCTFMLLIEEGPQNWSG